MKRKLEVNSRVFSTGTWLRVKENGTYEFIANEFDSEIYEEGTGLMVDYDSEDECFYVEED